MGYLVPARDALWDLPGWMCCSRAVAAVVGVILKIQVDILAKVL